MFTKRVLSNYLKKVPNKVYVIKKINRNYSNHVVIIGGGAMGSSTAYWLREKALKSNKDVNVVVIEKDPSYAKCSTALSVGGIRQQFTLPENIQMSLFGTKFISELKDRFGPDADISYKPNGYLLIASRDGAEQLEKNFRVQQELGVTNTLLSKKQLKKKFEWLNVEDVELGCLGCHKEGWFDPWSLLSLFKKTAIDKGVKYIEGEITNFVRNSDDLKGVEVKLSNGEEKIFPFDRCVLAAGADSGRIAKLANIGTGDNELSIALPVERRKRYVYKFDSQGKNRPQDNSPLTIDFTGTYFRNDGSSFIGGLSPKPEDEPTTETLDVDFEYFDRCVWPNLAHRIPSFESIKIQSAWGGYYEYNTFDRNGIIGPHSVYKNLYFATGFSGHGIQQSPATGLAIAELILDGSFQTIDLKRMGFDRLLTNSRMYETEIY